MFDIIASFDIGYSSVKLMKAKRGIRNFEIISVSMEEYDLDLFDNDSSAAISSALKRLIEQQDLSGCRIVTVIPSDRLLLRNITFPFSDMSKIAEAIPYEAEENIPYPIEDVVLDFQALPAVSSDGQSVILSAVQRGVLNENLKSLDECGIYPVFAGLEANAHLRCYGYFNSVSSENILVIDVGHKKTVVDIISNSSLIFTRSINTGISDIINYTADLLDISRNEARIVLRGLDLDLGSYESSLKAETFKQHNISKPKLKKIHDHACGIIIRIVEEISLTIKAGSQFNEFIEFSRIIITGGGSNIRGISKIISEESGIPVVYMPFLAGYLDSDIRSRFSVSLGNLLVYMNHKNESVNFVKGEFSRDLSGAGSNTYLLPAVFVSLSIGIFLLNLIITFIQVSRSQSYTDEILSQKYKRYFNTQTVPSDPLKDAAILLQKEQKEINVLKELIGDEPPFSTTLNLVTNSLQGTEGFDVRRFSFDGKSILVDGEAVKASDLEIFKKNLLDSGEFESVSINIRDTSKSRSLFTMTIKMKL